MRRGEEGHDVAFRIDGRYQVVSSTKPFRGMIGIVRAVQTEGWRIPPYFLSQVELPVGGVGYEYSDLSLCSHAKTR